MNPAILECNKKLLVSLKLYFHRFVKPWQPVATRMIPNT